MNKNELKEPKFQSRVKVGWFVYAGGLVSEELFEDETPIGVVAFKNQKGYYVLSLEQEEISWDNTMECRHLYLESIKDNYDPDYGNASCRHLDFLAQYQNIKLDVLTYCKEFTDGEKLGFLPTPNEYGRFWQKKELINAALRLVEAPLYDGIYWTCKLSPEETATVFSMTTGSYEIEDRTEEFFVRPVLFFKYKKS